MIGPALDPSFETIVPVYFLNGLGLAAATKRRLKDITPFLSLFPKAVGTDEPYNKGQLIATGKVLELIDKKVRQFFRDTTEFTDRFVKAGLNPQSPAFKKQVGQRVYRFLIDYVQYKQDAAGREELRRPARVVKEARRGVDCDCFAYFISTVLKNLGINHYLRIIACGEATTYHHIYVVIPEKWDAPCEPYKNKQNYTVVDPVLDTFNAEPNDIKAYHDYPMTVNNTAFSGLGAIATGDFLQKLKTTRKMMAANPSSYLRQGINPTVAVTMLDKAIAAWNTPHRTRVLNQLAQQEKAMYTGLHGLPMNGLFQNIVSTVKSAVNNVVDTVKTAVTDPAKLINDTVDRAKDIINQVIDYGREGLLFIPRKAYMALVALNVRGFAQRLKKGLDNKEVRARMQRIWEGDLGGDFNNLVNVINQGADKPFLFGLGALYGEPVTVASLLASAGAVIEIIKPVMDMIEKISSAVTTVTSAVSSGKQAVSTIKDLTSGNSATIQASTPTPGNSLIVAGNNTTAPGTNAAVVATQSPYTVVDYPSNGYNNQPVYSPPNPTTNSKDSNTGTFLLLAGGGVATYLIAKSLSGNKKKGKGLGSLPAKASHRRKSKHQPVIKQHVTF